MSAEHLQLLHLWSWGAFLLLIYLYALPSTLCSGTDEEGKCCIHGQEQIPSPSPQEYDCRWCSAWWNSGGMRSEKQGESFPSSSLSLFCSSSHSVPSPCMASRTHHSMVCPKEAESERGPKRGDLSPLSIKRAWKDAVWLVVLQETLWQLLFLMKQVSTLFWWYLLLVCSPCESW